VTALSRRFDEALDLATAIHADQVRKGSSTPYVAHLLGVASTVMELGGDEDEAVAALLHDALEDQPDRVSEADLRRQFGDRVADIVVACSDYLGPDPQNKPSWHQRKWGYVEHLLEETDLGVIRVSLADKLYNATAMRRDLERLGPQVWQRFKVGPADQLAYYDALAKAFEAKLPGPLTDEYAGQVARLHQLVEAAGASGDDPLPPS
jgi:(p)ppGpp synthase/HD superfamily hydrolase